MTYLGPSDAHVQDFLAALTDSLLDDRGDAAALTSYYRVAPAQVEGLVQLIQRLQGALVGVQPSRRFVRHLRVELVGEPDYNVITRIRYLPPRVQIAAGVALLAGLAFVARRRYGAGEAAPAADLTPAAR